MRLPAAPIPLLVALLVAAAPVTTTPVWADVVYLKDGRVLEGETRETPAGLEVSVKHGAVVVPHDQVARLEIRETPRQAYARLLEALQPADGGALLELIEHCAAHGLEQEARPLLAEAALRVGEDEDLALRLRGAYLRLDFRQEEGEWVPPEVWYPRHGYVRDRGRWLTPAQARLVHASRDLRAQEGRRKEAQEAVDDALRAVEVARRRVQAADRHLARATAAETLLPGQIAAARETLRARESDLAFARQQALLARDRYDLWRASPCACTEAACTWDARRVALYQDLIACNGRVPGAEAARDQALAEVQALLQAQATLPARRAAARERVLEAEQGLSEAEARHEVTVLDLERVQDVVSRAEQERAAAKAAADRAKKAQ